MIIVALTQVFNTVRFVTNNAAVMWMERVQWVKAEIRNFTIMQLYAALWCDNIRGGTV